ncbi:hypothetical protein UXP19_03125 [Enterobacter hormaechei]
MNINKDDELLVIVKYEGRFYWFVAFKEMWVLDRVKWVEDFVKSGVEINLQNTHKERYDIPVVNEENAQIFIEGLINDGYSYDKDDIAEEFYKRLSQKTIWWDIYELMPDLFIDFDNKRYIRNMLRVCIIKNMFLMVGKVNLLIFAAMDRYLKMKCSG